VAAKTKVSGVMQMTYCDACASAVISVTAFAEKVTGWNSAFDWFSRSAL